MATKPSIRLLRVAVSLRVQINDPGLDLIEKEISAYMGAIVAVDASLHRFHCPASSEPTAYKMADLVRVV